MTPRGKRMRSGQLRDFFADSAVTRFRRSNALLTLLYRMTDGRPTCTAFIVSKVVGNAVERNRVKRRLRATYRVQQRQVREGFELVFLARATVVTATPAEVTASMLSLLHRAEARAPCQTATSRRES